MTTEVRYPEEPIDAAVFSRLKEKDLDAFDLVYHAFRPRPFGFLLRLSRSRDVAEDLLQETWIRLAGRVSTLRDDTRLPAWLFTVARNLFLTWRRNRLLDETRTVELFDISCGSCDVLSPFEFTCGSELENRIEDVLAGMPLSYREALLLVVEGLTATEAAAACGLTPAAFRKRLSRARILFEKGLAVQSVRRIGAKRRESA
jgi:RNA polymerase sigma-70 factor (ECF subfamily)